MSDWQAPKTGWLKPLGGRREYVVPDNSPMDGFSEHIIDLRQIQMSESRINLGIHYFNNQLFSSNYVGIVRIKNIDGTNAIDEEGNELILKVVPRFNVTVVSLLNYIRDDDEFDRYMAPQTTRIEEKEKDFEAVDKNEIFYFFENEKPLKVDDGISKENSIITVTVFLEMLKALCRRPLMGRMLKTDSNLTGKVKGRIVVEKNMRVNTMRGRNDRFYCRFLHYTYDIVENQFLKAALKKAKRFLVDFFGNLGRDYSNYSTLISYCSNALKEVKDISCDSSVCNGLRFSGCYAYYRPVVDLAKMIIDGISIESTGAVNTTGYIVPYAISMDKLFEVYVRTYLKKNGFVSYKNKSKTGIVLEKFDSKTEIFTEAEELPNPGKYISGSIKPDIILTKQDTGETVVIDVKYKDYQSSYSRYDRLQLLAYCLMLNADNIGIILPAQDGETIFDPRKINSLEERYIKYHQMLLGINKNNSTVADYLKMLL